MARPRDKYELDEQPVEGYRLADYRRQFGLVSQRVVLFSDTVRANVAFGAGLITPMMSRCARRWKRLKPGRL